LVPAAALSNSPAMFIVVPGPAEPYVIFCVFALSMSSLRLETPSFGLTTSNDGTEPIRITGSKPLTGS